VTNENQSQEKQHVNSQFNYQR